MQKNRPSLKERIKKQFTSPMQFLIWVICLVIGAVEGGFVGAAAGFLTAFVCSLVSIIGLVPFVGIIAYWLIANKFISLIGGVGLSAPIASTVGLLFFTVITAITCVMSSITFIIFIWFLIKIRQRRKELAKFQ